MALKTTPSYEDVLPYLSTLIFTNELFMCSLALYQQVDGCKHCPFYDKKYVLSCGLRLGNPQTVLLRKQLVILHPELLI